MPNTTADNLDPAAGAWTASMTQPPANAATERLLEKFTEAPAVHGISAARNDIELVLDIPVQLTVELGRVRVPIKNILQLAQGSVIELDGLAGEPLDVMVNGCLIAQGEVVTVGERFGIRLTDIITPSERIRKLNR
jgi:flagellar motor switch protein FliN